MTDTDDDLTYAGVVQTYLAEARWLTPADAPHKLHLRRIAASLDAQFGETGQVQSALASTFHKVLAELNKRRPAPPPDPLAGQMPGQTDILSPEFGAS
ncbi:MULTISPECIES: hypothetical protein [unclassified Aeromicrobium]|uniref:hypothetical protein n=1 Tax=unclassified Aeromicrobium TaxID=2633570 RepID=UPI00288B2D0D|nr:MULTISPECIES: hypothetical protein [unclassified Aeromicrobium]